jgi:hypothetical protein
LDENKNAVLDENGKRKMLGPDETIIATIKEIKQVVFEPMFGEDKMLSMLHFLSRALAGHVEDKRFSTYLGNRNCGKGVLYDLLKCAFECYVDTFELGNLLYTR